MKSILSALSISAGLLLCSNVQATPAVYAQPGTQNLTTYTFTATATGDVVAYFAGSTASYTNELGMLVNGTAKSTIGLNNHTSSYGNQLNFGSVNAGDILVFMLITSGNATPWYSQQNMNSDQINHVYSSNYAGDSIIPAGTFVAFEDLNGGGDLNYNDEDFVFTNVSTKHNDVPEPASLALLGLGLVGLAASRRRKTI